MLRELKILAGVAALLTLALFAVTEWAATSQVAKNQSVTNQGVTNQPAVKQAARPSEESMRDARAELAAALKPSLAPSPSGARTAADRTGETGQRSAAGPAQALSQVQETPLPQAQETALPSASAPERSGVAAQQSAPAAQKVAVLEPAPARKAPLIGNPNPARIRFEARSFGVNPLAAPLVQASPLKTLAPIMASLPEQDGGAATTAAPEPRPIVAVAHPGRDVGPDLVLAPGRAALAAAGMRFGSSSFGVNAAVAQLAPISDKGPAVAEAQHHVPPDDSVGATPAPARMASAAVPQAEPIPTLPAQPLHVEAMTAGINASMLPRRTELASSNPTPREHLPLSVGPRPEPVTVRIDKWTLGVNGTALPARAPEPAPVVAAVPVPPPPVPVSRPVATMPKAAPPAPVSRPVLATAPAAVPPAPVPAPKSQPMGSDPSVFAVIPWPAAVAGADDTQASENAASTPPSPSPPSTPPASAETASAAPAADEGAASDDVTASTQVQDETPATSLAPSGEKIVLDQPKTKTGGRWTGCTKFKSYSAKSETYRGLDGLLHECKAD